MYPYITECTDAFDTGTRFLISFNPIFHIEICPLYAPLSLLISRADLDVEDGVLLIIMMRSDLGYEVTPNIASTEGEFHYQDLIRIK